jgi:hypothetical protein
MARRHAIHPASEGRRLDETANIYNVVYDNSYVGYAAPFKARAMSRSRCRRRAIPPGTSSTYIPRSTAVKNGRRSATTAIRTETAAQAGSAV